MSYIKKRQNKTTLHNDLQLEEYDDKHVFVKLLNPDAKDYWEDNLYDLNAIWKKKGWVVSKNKVEKLKVIMNMNYESDDDMADEKSPKSSRSEDSRGSDYSDESSSTDDELVQKALARRLMSESTQKEIDQDTIEDSEMEDIVSACRRFRFLYREIRMLKQRIAELEKRI